MNEEAAKALRAPFPDSAIGHLPRAGTKLSYVGHAAVTDRALSVDPEYFWEPLAFAADGSPLILRRGKDAVLWIRLTIAGVTRIGVGIVTETAAELEKQLISDALRNAAMRFGVALDLWAKEELPGGVEAVEAGSDSGQESEPASTSRVEELKEHARKLNASGIDVHGAAKVVFDGKVPAIAKSTPAELERWQSLLLDLDEMNRR